MSIAVETAVRVSYVLLSLYGLLVLLTRWRVYKVMTEDRRWLFLGLLLEMVTASISGVIKVRTGAPADVSIYLTVMTQACLTAYLHYSVPRSFRRWHTPLTRRT